MNCIKFFLICISLVVAVIPAQAESYRQLFGLQGYWKFEIGDDSARAAYRFDDSRWESVRAPSAWEDEGYPGYDGFAWYRKHFRSSPEWQEKALVVLLGTIDDVDEVYVNGHLVGRTGNFPPGYTTAWNVQRSYPLPVEYLNASGDNVVAIRVYDQELNGGITSGPLGIFENESPLAIKVPLNKGWMFHIGDDITWKNESVDPRGWKPIFVPAYWETQGYPDYDGFAWYRVTFVLPQTVGDQQLILLLGKIDDFDQTFLNGREIGHTGNMARRNDIPGSNEYQELRSYIIPSDYLRYGRENTIAVRVYDGYRDGGIYAGPIGIATRADFVRWQKKQYRANNPFEWLDWIFR